MQDRKPQTTRESLHDKCGAGMGGGCSACEKCDPAWWAELKKNSKIQK